MQPRSLNKWRQIYKVLNLKISMPHGAHHLYRRKHIDHAPYPHPDKKIRVIDTIAMINCILMPLTTVPQIYKIYIFKEVAGISLAMWIMYSISCSIMLMYAITHKLKQLIVLNLLWLIAQLVIIFGVLIYT